MKNNEKELKNKFIERFSADSQPSKDLYEKVCDNLDLEKKEKVNFSFKKLIPTISVSLCLILAVIIGIVIINGNRPGLDKNINYNAIVQVDVNPSIQLVVDQDKKVLSVIGLNDEGKMVICGELIVGKTIDEALEVIINVETSMGYINKGETDNKVTITVSAETEKIYELVQTNVEESLNKAFEKIDVEASIEKVKGYVAEELKELAKELDPTLTDIEIANFNYDQLVNVVKLYHLEVADLATEKLEDFYNEFKEYKIDLTEKEAVLEAVENLDGIYQMLKVTYQTAYIQVENSYQALQQSYYETFIDTNSEYKQKWIELVVLKEKYLNQKEKVAGMLNNSSPEELTIEQLKLSQYQFDYEAMLFVLETIEKNHQASYENLCEMYDSAIEYLNELEKQLPESIQSITFETLVDTEAKLNAFKNETVKSFEEEYKDEIKKAQDDLAARKKEIIDSLHS